MSRQAGTGRPWAYLRANRRRAERLRDQPEPVAQRVTRAVWPHLHCDEEGRSVAPGATEGGSSG